MPGIVLLYHAILDRPGDCNREEARLFVSPDRFSWQIRDLARRGFYSVRLDEYEQSSSNSILITFDDAYAHVDEAVTPVLRRHGFTGVMFVPWHHVGSRNTWDSHLPHMSRLGIATPTQLVDMAQSGIWEIACHGHEHVDLRRMEATKRRAELVSAREALSDLLHRPVWDLAYPFGFHDASVRRDARLAGYRRAFAAGPGAASDQYQLPRHPVSGTDGAGVFRFKTSSWFDRLGGAHQRTPDWAKRSARSLADRVVTG